jgi:hypothetical protein
MLLRSRAVLLLEGGSPQKNQSAHFCQAFIVFRFQHGSRVGELPKPTESSCGDFILVGKPFYLIATEHAAAQTECFLTITIVRSLVQETRKDNLVCRRWSDLDSSPRLVDRVILTAMHR